MKWLRRNSLCDRPTRRRESRRPQFDDLEGRQLLSTIGGQNFGAPISTPQGGGAIAQPAILFPVFCTGTLMPVSRCQGAGKLRSLRFFSHVRPVGPSL
jgi:hypothetical protein